MEGHNIGTINHGVIASVQPGRGPKAAACFTTAVTTPPLEPYDRDRVQACEWFFYHSRTA